MSRPGYPGHPANIAKVLVDRVLGQDAVVITMIDARAGKHSPASVEGSCEVYTGALEPSKRWGG